MAKVEYDYNLINVTLSCIDGQIDSGRDVLNKIIKKYDEIVSYDNLVKSNNAVRAYGEVVDDYGKICSIITYVSEALMDLKSIRKAMRDIPSVPSLEKSINVRIDYQLDSLSIFKDGLASTKNALEAKVRYYNSCLYMNYDKTMGPKS